MALARGAVALIVVALISGACGGQPTTSGQPTARGSPSTTDQRTPSAVPTSSGQPSIAPSPGNTDQPPPTDFPDFSADLPPLPEPTLTTVDEIFQAMGSPGGEEQVVVSVLDLLGIGLYKPDGTPIRAGSESSDADLFLWEPEARGLVNMLRAQYTDDGWMEFRDFHGALAQYGYTGSAEDLAAAYNDLFAAEPDAPMTQLIGYVDADVPITRFTAWLLIVDGFVPWSGEARAVPGLARTSGRGVAQIGVSITIDPNVLAHLILVANSAQPVITVDPTQAHEGHGAPGSPVEIRADVHALAVTWVSPFTGSVHLIPAQAQTTDGIGVTFEPNRTLTKHGEILVPIAHTDGTGRATVVYTPRREPLDGMGVQVSTVGVVVARVSVLDVMTRLYGQPGLAAFAPPEVSSIGMLQIEWHDEPPLQIDFTNTYNLELPFEVLGTAQTAGQDYIQGDLIVDEDDPLRWEGTALAYAKGSFSGELFGRSCSTNWDTQQILQVTGLEDIGSGEMLFVFQPLTPVLGDTGDPTCNTSRPPSPDGIAWAPFNDLGVTDPGIGLRFNVAIPRPGFLETSYPVPLAGTGVTGYADWLVKIEFVAETP